MYSLKLISLNIERSKHLDLVLPFLEREQPDVFCVQELHEPDIVHFEKMVGPCAGFAPVSRHLADAPSTDNLIMGSAIFTRLPVHAKEVRYYRGSEEHARMSPAKHVMEDIPLVACEVASEDGPLRVMTTHFTWSKDGLPNEQQRIDMRELLGILEEKENFVLCGDINAPRGGEIFTALAQRYKDNVSGEYKTSLDKNIHRAGDLELMVDGLFTTPGYIASNVHLQFGVSDHAAIVATIEKAV